MDHIFKRYGALKDLWNGDQLLLWLNVTGLTLIAVTFMIIGVMCVVMAEDPDPTGPKGRNRIILTKLFGMFLITCAFARIIDIVAIWHSYSMFNAILRLITGIFAMAAIMFIPAVVRESKNMRSLYQVKLSMDETKEKLDSIEELGKKLDNK